MAAVLTFKTPVPSLEDVGIAVPRHLDLALFEEGFSHGMRSNELTNFKASFRAGFREAKCYLRMVRSKQGVREIGAPVKFHASTR